jgi:hypothetical protein
MAKRHELECALTQEQFEEMHRNLDDMHSSASKVYISKQALKNMLYDHAQFCGLVEDFKGLCEIKESKLAAREASFAYMKYRDLKGMPTDFKSAFEDENEEETTDASVDPQPEENQDGTDRDNTNDTTNEDTEADDDDETLDAPEPP